MKISRLTSILVLGLATLGATSLSAQQTKGLAGSYLAARQAAIGNDYTAAADYFVRALARDASVARGLARTKDAGRTTRTRIRDEK